MGQGSKKLLSSDLSHSIRSGHGIIFGQNRLPGAVAISDDGGRILKHRHTDYSSGEWLFLGIDIRCLEREEETCTGFGS
jgi:hypothetical protein